MQYHDQALHPKWLQYILKARGVSFACAGSPKDGFECIVIDPPWENASAQRSNAYPTLPSRNLLGIPVKRLLHQVQVTAHCI